MPNVHTKASQGSPSPAKVVSLDERRQRRQPQSPHYLRLSPEHDGIEILYSNHRFPDQLFSLRALAWALKSDGEVVALVPWLTQLTSAPELTRPMEAEWVGYRLPDSDYFFTEAPEHKVRELEAARNVFGADIHQQIPDTIGTHAVFSEDNLHTLQLAEVVAWELDESGIHPMIADEDQVTRTPILPHDPCLVRADSDPSFRYFFQHGIANRIKDQDPEALAAVAMLCSE